MDNDSAGYYAQLSYIEGYNNNFEIAIEYGEKAFELAPYTRDRYLIRLIRFCMYQERYEESLKYLKEPPARKLNVSPWLPPNSARVICALSALEYFT